jgi:hypothetical protein
MATDNQSAPNSEGETEELTEPVTETRTLQELIDAGYADHVRGSDSGAMIDVHPPRSPEKAARWKLQNSPELDK